MPKVSIIVPVYNVSKKFLRKCLDSLKNQSLKDIEIICINDGSTDDSLQILEQYQMQDKRFIVITQDNQGQGAARQRGIETAKGEYIGFVDSDDYIEITMYEKLYNQAKKLDSDIVECGFNAILDWNKKIIKVYNIDDYNEILNNIKILEDKNYYWKDILENLKNKYYAKNFTPVLWNKIFKTSLIRENNIKAPLIRIMGEDVILYIDILLQTEKISFLQEALYNYIIHPSSSLRTWNILKQQEVYRKNLYAVVKKHNLFNNTVKKAIDNYIMAFYVEYADRGNAKAREENKKYIESALNSEEYEKFLAEKKEFDKKHGLSFGKQIFSVRNDSSDAVCRKIITILGIKIKFKKKKVEE